MGAAISIFVLMSLSVFVMRIASVALRLTGLEESQAKFQSLSAFTGTGFTTGEAEMIVNYPVRRRIISLLMVVGNLGLVTVLATLVTSLVNTEGAPQAVLTQLIWLFCGLALLWVLMLNPVADRILCTWIGRWLNKATLLGQRRFHRLLQLGDGYSVCEHPLPFRFVGESVRRLRFEIERRHMALVTILSLQGNQVKPLTDYDYCLRRDDRLILFAADNEHEAFEDKT